MSVLIKGIEMPSKKAIAVVIQPDGTAYSTEMFAGVCTKHLADCTAVPVPPHGDLIDRDETVRDLRMDYAYAAARIVSLQPVIIPAEENTQKDGGQDEAPAGPYDLLYEEGGLDTR